MKNNRKLKIKESICALATTLIMTTLLVSNNSFAAEDKTNKSPVRESETTRLSYPSIFQLLSKQVDGDYVYITHEDLIKYPSLFCSAKGTGLPGYSSTVVTSGGKSTDTTDGGTSTGMLTKSAVNHATVFQSDAGWTTSSSNPYSTTTSKTYGRFKIESVEKTTPAEAWVLSETINNDPSKNSITYTMTDKEYTKKVNDKNKYTGKDNTELWAVEWDEESFEPTKYVAKKDDKYYYVTTDSYAPYTYVQHAWWKEKTVGTTNKSGVKDTDLAYEAEAFEKYMEKIAVLNNGKTGKEKWQYNEDNTIKVDYTNYISTDGSKKQLSSDSTQADVRFDANKNKYIVGPFTLNYLRAGTKQGTREKVSFSGISNTTLIATNGAGEELYDSNGESVLKLGKNYKFVYDHNHEDYIPYTDEKKTAKLDTEEDYPYPYDGEEFYIEIDYLDEITSLKSIDFDFQYMNAGGSYEYLTGTYLILTWTPWHNYIPSTGGEQTSGSSAFVTNENLNIAMNISSRDGANNATDTSVSGSGGQLIGEEQDKEHIHEGETEYITFEGDESEDEEQITIKYIDNPEWTNDRVIIGEKEYAPIAEGIDYYYSQTSSKWTYEGKGDIYIKNRNNGNDNKITNADIENGQKLKKDFTIPLEKMEISIQPKMKITTKTTYYNSSGEKLYDGDEEVTYHALPIAVANIKYSNKISEGIKLDSISDSTNADVTKSLITYEKQGIVNLLKTELSAKFIKNEINCGQIKWIISNATQYGDGTSTSISYKPSDEGSSVIMQVVAEDGTITQEFKFDVDFPTMYVGSRGEKEATVNFSNVIPRIDYGTTETCTLYNIYEAATPVTSLPNNTTLDASSFSDTSIGSISNMDNTDLANGNLTISVYENAIKEGQEKLNANYQYVYRDNNNEIVRLNCNVYLYNYKYKEYCLKKEIENVIAMGHGISADQARQWLEEADDNEYDLGDLRTILENIEPEEKKREREQAETTKKREDIDDMIYNFFKEQHTAEEYEQFLYNLRNNKRYSQYLTTAQEERITAKKNNREEVEKAVNKYKNGQMSYDEVYNVLHNSDYLFSDLWEQAAETKAKRDKNSRTLKKVAEYLNDAAQGFTNWAIERVIQWQADYKASGGDTSNETYQASVEYVTRAKKSKKKVTAQTTVEEIIKEDDNLKAELEKNLQEMEQQINEMLQKIENEKQALNNTIQECINELIQKRNNLTSELESIEKELATTTDADRKAELESKKLEIQTNINNINTVIDALQRMININTSIEDLRKQEDELKKNQSNIQEQIYDLQKKQLKLKGDAKKQNKQKIKELNTQLSSINQQLNEVSKTKTTKEQERINICQTIRNYNVLDESKQTELEKLISSVMTLEMTRDNYDDEKENIEVQILENSLSSNSAVSFASSGSVITGLQVGGAGKYQHYLRLTNATGAKAQDQAHPIDIKVKDVDADNGRGADPAGPAVHLQILPEPINLRTSISGSVWIDQDEDPKNPNSGTLGIYDSTDTPAAKNSVEIIVWKVTYDKNGNEVEREKAIGWDENQKVIDFMENKLYIDEKGNYTIPEIQIPSIEGLDTSKYSVAYDVEFIYDGQTYEATEYLKSAGKDKIEDKLEEFKLTAEETKGAEKDYTKFAKDSYIVENADERKAFDSYFTEIYGKEDINVENGNTTGESTGGTGGAYYSDEYRTQEIKNTTLNYTSSAVGEGDNAKRQSTLVTTNSEGYVEPQYRFAARTSTSGLVLPYESQYHVEKEYYDNLVFQKTNFKPIDEYFDHINLGLLKRYETDVSLLKDLYSAKVVVNEQQTNYTYNSLGTLTGEALSQQVDAAYRSRTYKLDLYNSDYYYRSNVYGSIRDNITKQVLQAIKSDTELRLFVTYKIAIHNESNRVDVSINEFKDYYDKTFTLVDQDISASIVDNNDNRSDQTVAYAPYFRKIKAGSSLSENYKWNKEEDLKISNIDEGVTGNVVFNNIDGYNDENYKGSKSSSLRAVDEKGQNVNTKMTLEPGEYFEVFVTYEVDYKGWNEARTQTEGTSEREDLLGLKSNIAEISNYSTVYTSENVARHATTSYKENQISGRVDRDSAPDNINLKNLDKAKFFEDDTEYAPTLEIKIKEGTNRTLSGTVWEDEREKDEGGKDKSTGNGILDEGESGIGGVDVTLVEKIKVNPGDIDKNIEGINAETLDYEFEFIWPKNAFGDKLEYTSKVKSSENEENKGYYEFKNFVSGMYVVRFEYGNNEATLKYNGQDYKNTSYQTGMTNTTEEITKAIRTSNAANQSTLNNEWHDLSNNDNAKALEEKRVSDARDYEPRRMQVMAYSRTITNQNAEVLSAYINDQAKGKLTEYYKNILEANKDELIEKTAMVANTAKFNVEVEKQDSIAYKTVKTTEGDINNEEKHSYNIINVDFGLVRRPETRIDIKQEISKIQLLKNDGQEVVLSVECDENGDIIRANGKTSANISKITEIRKDQLTDGGQGFKYIAMEASYLQGLTVQLTYKINITNNSETDYVGEYIANTKDIQSLYNKAKEYEREDTNSNGLSSFNTGEGIIYGKYLGLNYYTGTTENNGNYGYDGYKDIIVKTTIDQLVDYVDNDINIDKEATTNIENQSWINSTETDRENKFSKASYKNTEENEYTDKNFVDDKGRAYVAEPNKNNIVLTENENMSSDKEQITYTKTQITETGEPAMREENGVLMPQTEDKTFEAYTTAGDLTTHQSSAYNPLLTVELEPGQTTQDTYITLSAQANEDTMNNMNYNNLIEIVMYSNSAGRRDMQTIPGNANMIAKEQEAFKAGSNWKQTVELSEGRQDDEGNELVTGVTTERDAYAARDTITFSEPTGLGLQRESINKIVRIILISLVIAAIAVITTTIILVIKKTKYDDKDLLNPNSKN